MGTWVIAGDSITVGMAEELSRLLEGMGQRGTVVAQVGMSVREMAREWLPAALATPVDVLLVMLGTNPSGRMTSGKFRSDVDELLAVAQGRARYIGWIGPWADGEDVDERMVVIRELVGWRTVDGRVLSAGLERAGEDRVHFARLSYPVLAGRVVDWASRVVAPLVVRRGRGGVVAMVVAAAAAVGVPLVAGRFGR